MIGFRLHGIVSLGVLATALLAACATHEAPPPGEPVSRLPALQHPADNPATPAKLALGAQLFIDTRLSASGRMACQGCHYRHLGWTDGKALSVKDDGSLNTRHTPTLYNVGYQAAWYRDGRATTLEGQVLAAWRGQMGADPNKVAALLNSVPGYRSAFQAAFGTDATADAIVKALAADLRTKLSTDAPWDRYEKGDRSAVSRDAVEGFQLFMGKGRCAACHLPPTYGASGYHNIGHGGKARSDAGRFNVSQLDADIGAFKTPTLRSIALSAPYFHDGSVATLRDAVKLMANGGGNDPRKSPMLTPTGLNEAEIDKLVAFLNTLTSTEAWVAPQLP